METKLKRGKLKQFSRTYTTSLVRAQLMKLLLPERFRKRSSTSICAFSNILGQHDLLATQISLRQILFLINFVSRFYTWSMIECEINSNLTPKFYHDLEKVIDGLYGV